MKSKKSWTSQETFALIWLLAAISIAIIYPIAKDLNIPIFTLFFLILTLVNLIINKSAARIGMGKIKISSLLKWTGINLGALILVYTIFEPWSGAYAFLLEEATGPESSDPTFALLNLIDGAGGWTAMFLFSALISIFAEELFFRGWLQNLLRPKVGPLWANIIQSAAFTLPQLILAFLMPSPIMGLVLILVYAFGAIGMINGWVATRAGAIWPNLFAASIMNLILSILILGF
ncbi:MAG: type II CAAX prenyl endopeptidase Rce1 family protein [Brevefilum sp.]